MNEKYYLYKGKLFSEGTLKDKYGEDTNAKIKEYGFEEAYSYEDKIFSSSQLKEKYGDEYESIISDKGITPYGVKKKEQTQPQEEVSTSDSQTPAQPSGESGERIEDVDFDTLPRANVPEDERLSGAPEIPDLREVTDVRAQAGIEKSFAPNPIQELSNKLIRDKNEDAYDQAIQEVRTKAEERANKAAELDTQKEELSEQANRLKDFVFKLPSNVERGKMYEIEVEGEKQVVPASSIEEYKQRYSQVLQQQEQLNQGIESYNKEYQELAKREATLSVAKKNYELAQDSEVRKAVGDVVQSLPLPERLGATLIGSVGMGLEQIAGSALSGISTSDVGVSEEEIQDASPEARKVLIEARNELEAEKTDMYKTATNMLSSSAETAEQYGLAKSLEDVDSPESLINFAVTSFGEQIPQFAQGAVTLGYGTYIQELGGIKREIVGKLMEDGATLEEALQSNQLKDIDANIAALGIASLDLLGLATMGAGRLIKPLSKLSTAKYLKNPYLKATTGTVGEVGTEITQEAIAKGGVTAVLEDDFMKGFKSLTLNEAKEVGAKVLFGAAPVTSVNAFTETGAVNQDLLDEASVNPKTKQVIKGVIDARQKAGIITEEQAQLQIGDLEKGIEANLQIPEDIQGEQRAELVELQKLHDELTEAKSQASPAFAPTYNERLKNVEEQMQEVASRKEERTTVEQYGDKQEVKTGKRRTTDDIQKEIDEPAVKEESNDFTLTPEEVREAEEAQIEFDVENELIEDLEGEQIDRIYEAQEQQDQKIKEELGEFASKMQYIHENLGRIRPEDFDRVGDPNVRKDMKGFNIKHSSKKARPLDTMVEEMSEVFGQEITEQDVIDYIMDREANPDKYKKSKAKQLKDAAQIPTSAQEAVEIYRNLKNDKQSIDAINKLRGTVLTDGQADIIIKNLKERDARKSETQQDANRDIQPVDERAETKEPTSVNETDLQDGGKAKKRKKKTSVISETEGLTEKERTKQGVEELVQSYKERIKTAKEKLQQVISDVKATSREKQKALRDAGKAVSDFIKEAVPRGAKIPKSLAQAAVKATTPRAVERVTQKIEDYIKRSDIASKKKKARAKQKEITKRLNKTSEYTNKERAVQNLLAALNVTGIESAELLDKINNVLDDIANKPIAKVRETEIQSLTDEVSKYEPPKKKTTQSVESLEEKILDKDLSIRQRGLALSKLNNLLEEKKEQAEDINDKDVNDLEAKINDLAEKLSEDAKEDIKQTNEETKELLKNIDDSDMSPEQKEMIRELKKQGISDDFRRSKQLNDIALELSFGYAPIAKMQDYITSVKSEKAANISSQKIDSQAKKRKTPIQELVSKTWRKFIIPKVFRKKGLDDKSLRQVISDLRLESIERWDDLFGLGKEKPIQKYVINPLETAITKMNTVVRDSIKELFDQGIINKESRRKIVMAVTQAYWDKYKTGENYWQELINNNEFKNENPSRHEELVKDFESMPKTKDGKVDYDKYLGELKGKEKKVYDWIVKNNERLLEKQKIANERRGQKFEPIDSRYYIPMKRKSDGLAREVDDSFIENLWSMFSTGATKLKSDRGEVRNSGKIQDLNMDIYALVADQIYQTNRDYFVTETVRQSVKTMSKTAARVSDLDAKKYAKAMVNGLKSRLNREFGAKPKDGMGIVNKMFSYLYQYVLIGSRLVPELLAETVRTVGAADIRKQPTALRLGSVKDIMDFTGSPFISNLYFENLDYASRKSFNKSSIGRMFDLISIGNQKILSTPDSLTFKLIWTPSFLKAFEQAAGKKFDISAYKKNKAKYLSENEDAIKEAGAFADSEAQAIKGSKTRFAQREAVRVLPEFMISMIKAMTDRTYGYADASSTMGKIITTLQNFAFLEQLNIGNNIRGIVYGENKSRSRASSELVTAVASGTLYTFSASALYHASNILLASALGDDEDEKKARKELDELMSVEGVYDSVISNALFLSTAKYGNIGKTAILISIGLYDTHLKNTLPKKEYKRRSEELAEATRGRFFSAPIDLGGYKSESDIMNAVAPFVSRTIGLVGESVKGVAEGVSKINNDKADEWVAMKLMNDVVKLMMIVTGAPLPFQKDIDKILKKKVKIDEKKGKKTKGTVDIGKINLDDIEIDDIKLD